MSTALVAVGGAVGAVLRYRIGIAIGVRSFPWATLGINLSGSFLLALLLTGPAVARWPPSATTAIAVGVLGAYTTFSTFGFEAFTLLRTERVGLAVGYIGLSLVGGLAATAIGYAAGRALS